MTKHTDLSLVYIYTLPRPATNHQNSQKGIMMVPTLVKLLGKTVRDHTTAVLELTNLLEGTMLILTTRNVCMPELTPVQINGEVMPGQLEFQVPPSVGFMCFGLCFAADLRWTGR
ncbi:uncharacterized protein LOC106422622 isoform X2 [Brassica napus]|uniref:(rape) hypothetical protein n=1 Tax=Brassica napus TaxID=3708 RepID=A0A817A3S7_BRANA|nr:uncharacterized protein LOC106422622 isoform X2 [Brassica napus]CAF2225129.1 unnamed protein product [Brassica napus]